MWTAKFSQTSAPINSLISGASLKSEAASGRQSVGAYDEDDLATL
jgi:hypothetical protein